jgi:hypothetical protein
MRTTTTVALIGMLALGTASGCAMQQEQNLSALQDPKRINCATADGDLRILEGEKANVGQRIAEGATAIYPAGLVVGLLTGTEGTKLKVATGDYDQQIDQRIAEIKQTCGIQ